MFNIGVLALQGDVEEHLKAASEAIRRLGVVGNVFEIKDILGIEKADAIILPGEKAQQ